MVQTHAMDQFVATPKWVAYVLHGLGNNLARVVSHIFEFLGHPGTRFPLALNRDHVHGEIGHVTDAHEILVA